MFVIFAGPQQHGRPGTWYIAKDGTKTEIVSQAAKFYSLNLKNAPRTAFYDLFPRRSKDLSFANSEISRQPQPIDLA